MRTVGAISGFGQAADFIPQNIQDFLFHIFGAAANDDGMAFLNTLKKIIHSCPEKLRDSLADHLTIGNAMEERLKRVMRNHPDQLYLLGGLSWQCQSALDTLCNTVGVGVPVTFNGPIDAPMTAMLAMFSLTRNAPSQFGPGRDEGLFDYSEKLFRGLQDTTFSGQEKTVFNAVQEYMTRPLPELTPLGATRVSLSDTPQPGSTTFERN